MKIKANSPEEYIQNLPEDRIEAMSQLRSVIKNNLPKGFVETISYGMIGYVVPHSMYPEGYHCDPSLPLPFMNLASQKNYIAIYHSGIYANAELYEWFIKEFQNRTGKKPDMGKSCIRIKNMNHIPFDLIGELVQKISPQQWIAIYESLVKNRK